MAHICASKISHRYFTVWPVGLQAIMSTNTAKWRPFCLDLFVLTRYIIGPRMVCSRYITVDHNAILKILRRVWNLEYCSDIWLTEESPTSPIRVSYGSLLCTVWCNMTARYRECTVLPSGIDVAEGDCGELERDGATEVYLDVNRVLVIFTEGFYHLVQG